MIDPELKEIYIKYLSGVSEIIFTFANDQQHSIKIGDSSTSEVVCNKLQQLAISMDHDIHLNHKQAEIVELKELLAHERRMRQMPSQLIGLGKG